LSISLRFDTHRFRQAEPGHAGKRRVGPFDRRIDVGDHDAVGSRIQRRLEQAEARFEFLADEGVPDRPPERVVLKLSLDQIVLRTGLESRLGQLMVVLAPVSTMIGTSGTTERMACTVASPAESGSERSSRHDIRLAAFQPSARHRPGSTPRSPVPCRQTAQAGKADIRLDQSKIARSSSITRIEICRRSDLFICLSPSRPVTMKVARGTQESLLSRVRGRGVGGEGNGHAFHHRGFLAKS
jgi:hypothetical protein